MFFFLLFFIHGTFLTFFILPTFFIFKNVHWKYHRKSLSKQRKQIGSVWLFFFVPMLEFPYRPILTSIVTYLAYMHRLCKILNTPVMSICLVKHNDGTWVEKHQRFLFNVYKRFFLNFCHVFYVFSGFFSGTFFLHLWFLCSQPWCANGSFPVWRFSISPG